LAHKQVPSQLIESVREHSDLLSLVSEYLSLKKAGQNYVGLCPFHQEKSPSFSVNPLKQFFHCFGCGEGGDVFRFLEKIEGLSFSEALSRLAERANIPLPSRGEGLKPSESDDIYRLNKAAAAYFHQNLLEDPKAAPARSYLEQRGITMESIQNFSIGYAMLEWDHLLRSLGRRFPLALLEKSGLVSRRKREQDGRSTGAYDRFRNRILFPIYTLQGRVAGFGGRVLDGSLPKYLNSPETPVFTKGRQLYGLHRINRKEPSPLILVEGYLDVISASQFGIPNVVATLGTALTEDHLGLVRRVGKRLVLVFDGDEAGLRAARRAVPLLITQRLSSTIASLPPGKDPDAFLQESGPEAFLSELEKGQAPIDFSIAQAIKALPDASIRGKMAVIEQVLPLIESLSSPVEKGHFIKSLAEALALPEEDIRLEAFRRSGRRSWRERRESALQPLKQRRRLPEAEETILALILQDGLDPERLNGTLGLSDFTDPDIRSLLSRYWQADSGCWVQKKLVLEGLNPAEQALLTRLSLAEINTEQVAQMAQDCIRQLLNKSLERKKNELDKKLKHAEKEGDLEAVDQQNREIMRVINLKRRVSELSLSR